MIYLMIALLILVAPKIVVKIIKVGCSIIMLMSIVSVVGVLLILMKGGLL